MKRKTFRIALAAAAACVLLSCQEGQKANLGGVQFVNYSSMKEVAEGKSLDRTKFVLPAGPENFGRKLYSEKTICFTDVEWEGDFGARTCTATVYERGVSIEVDGQTSYFDAEGMETMPSDHDITLTCMPSKIPGARWQPAIVTLDEESFWQYQSLYNRGDVAHRDVQLIKGWYWTYAKNQGYEYKKLLLD